MEKFLCLALAITSVTMAFANGEKAKLSQKERMLEFGAVASKVGGLVCKPATGRIVFVSGQKKVAKAEVDELSRRFSEQVKMHIDVAETDLPFSVNSARSLMASNHAQVAVFIMDSDILPISLVSLEERWALVNVNRLVVPGLGDGVATKRVQREISRSFKALFSAVELRKGVMAVSSPDDLDKITWDPIDGPTLVNIVNGLPSYGIVRQRVVTYKRACMEGWAPAPTNDVQKKIWDEVRVLPSDPIKIKYDPKRDK